MPFDNTNVCTSSAIRGEWACGNDRERTITITLGEYEDMKKVLKRFREFRGLVDGLVLALNDSEIAKDAEVIKALSFVKNY